jgi:hypothetical protein
MRLAIIDDNLAEEAEIKRMKTARMVGLLVIAIGAASGIQSLLAQSIQVRVLDGRSGSRIPNEKVSVLIKGEKDAREFRTDDKGDFMLLVEPSADIFVATEWRVTCRTTKPGVIPYVPVAQVLREGVTVPNSCGKAKSENIKGRLVIFSRKASFLENIKR